MWIKKIIYFIVLTIVNTSFIQSNPTAGSTQELHSSGEWRLEKINAKSPRVGGLFIQFEMSGKMSGFSGCNEIFGVYSIDPEKKSIQVLYLTNSKKNCGNDSVMLQEASFLSKLRDISKYDIAGNKLIIHTKKNETLSFKFLKKQKYNNKLTGKLWLFTYLTDINGTPQFIRIKMTLRFENGRFSTNTICQTLKGKYVKSGNKLRFQDVTLRKKRCSIPMEKENMVKDILKGAETFKLTGGEILHIFNKESIGLRFVVI
ncbi:MAG: META domain-containing protein [Spirochaetota bacterium]|nr:META domain-containing protein [Spirochaetota bacterium]